MGEVITAPVPGPNTPAGDQTSKVVIDNKIVVDDKDTKDATREPGGLHVHPMSCEGKHLLIGGIVGLVLGLFVGYWEMQRRNKGWEYIAGFGAGGLLLGLGIGCALPARKRHEIRRADGRTEVCYTD